MGARPGDSSEGRDEEIWATLPGRALPAWGWGLRPRMRAAATVGHATEAGAGPGNAEAAVAAVPEVARPRVRRSRRGSTELGACPRGREPVLTRAEEEEGGEEATEGETEARSVSERVWWEAEAELAEEWTVPVLARFADGLLRTARVATAAAPVGRAEPEAGREGATGAPAPPSPAASAWRAELPSGPASAASWTALAAASCKEPGWITGVEAVGLRGEAACAPKTTPEAVCVPKMTLSPELCRRGPAPVPERRCERAEEEATDGPCEEEATEAGVAGDVSSGGFAAAPRGRWSGVWRGITSPRLADLCDASMRGCEEEDGVCAGGPVWLPVKLASFFSHGSSSPSSSSSSSSSASSWNRAAAREALALASSCARIGSSEARRDDDDVAPACGPPRSSTVCFTEGGGKPCKRRWLASLRSASGAICCGTEPTTIGLPASSTAGCTDGARARLHRTKNRMVSMRSLSETG